MITFVKVSNAAPQPGMVLHLNKPEPRFMRVTHAFAECVYIMWVAEPSAVRTVGRPARKSLAELEKIVDEHGGEWGQLELPPTMTTVPAPESERAHRMNEAWRLIAPLVEAFDNEVNLARANFLSLIRARAIETGVELSILRRLILRFYYFGRTRLGLLSLPPGTKLGGGGYAPAQESSTTPKRRGRKTILSCKLGENEFVVLKCDIEDMVTTFTSLLRLGPAHKTIAHERYLAGAFRRRHPHLHQEYISGKILEPVTARQYSYYVNRNLQVSEQLAKNVRTHRRNAGHLGSLRCAGPGEVYEIDSTGGRLYLVSADDPPIQLGKPTIYFLIDRWSRFVVSAYLSLKPPSYEEVRHALLVAFTSRERRFKALGVAIDDERWPVGQMPAVICPDRGAEFMSTSMEQAVVNDLRVELTPLPPYCPDGKAIVERFIREVKRRMSASDLKGTYADRPLDPNTKKAAQQAEDAAVHSLTEAYRSLIETIDDHNNRPHATLRKRRMLTQAGVEPTPKAVYLWGLKNIIGLRKAPFTDADYKRMLLATDQGSIGSGVLKYRKRPYSPANEIAEEMAVRSTNLAKEVDIRLDKTDPSEIFVVNTQGQWGLFVITSGAANEIAGLSLDEEELLSPQQALSWAISEHDARVDRVASMSVPRKKPVSTKPATHVTKAEQSELRTVETDAMKTLLAGKKSKSAAPASPAKTKQSEWERHEDEERMKMLKIIQKQRGRS